MENTFLTEYDISELSQAIGESISEWTENEAEQNIIGNDTLWLSESEAIIH